MIASKPRDDDTAEARLERVRTEYRELPTLNPTFAQACLLWHMEPRECTRVLERLVAEGVLQRTAEGLFVSPTNASSRLSRRDAWTTAR